MDMNSSISTITDARTRLAEVVATAADRSPAEQRHLLAELLRSMFDSKKQP